MMTYSLGSPSFAGRVKLPHMLLLLIVAASSAFGQDPGPRTAVERALTTPGHMVRTTVLRSWAEGGRGLLIERLHVVSGEDARDGVRITWRDNPPWSQAFIDADESMAVREALTAMLAFAKKTLPGRESNYERLSFLTLDGIEFFGENRLGKFEIGLRMPQVSGSIQLGNESVPQIIEALAP